MVVRPAGQLSNAADVCSGAYYGGEDAEEAEGGRGGGGEVGRVEGWESCGIERVVRFLATVEVEA